MPVLSSLAKFARKAYRDGYLHTQVRSSIAYQIQALREKLGLSQTGFAELTGKKQSVISRLESTEYGRATVQTLLDIASAADVALVVRFVSYPEFMAYATSMSDAALTPDTIFESLDASRSPALRPRSEKFYELLRPTSAANDDRSEPLADIFGRLNNQRPRFAPQSASGQQEPAREQNEIVRAVMH